MKVDMYVETMYDLIERYDEVVRETDSALKV